jgi:PcrA/UvrD helicase-like protein
MNDQDFQVGDWVRHPDFGDGLILESKGGGESASVLVSFPDNSRRRLMVKFARLSRLEPQPGPPSRAKHDTEGKKAVRAKPRKRTGGA